jgi:hypothetical protein
MTNHWLLPGSLTIDGDKVSAGVHSGKHEWDVAGDLRFVEGYISKAPDKNILLEDWLFQIYENSTGSLTHDDFRMNP